MSYSNPYGSAERFTEPLQHARSLPEMAAAVIILMGAGLLAAVYHAANEEIIHVLKGIRLRGQLRAVRHETILLLLLGSELDLGLQEFLLKSRDAFRACLILLSNPILTPDERDLVREALMRAQARD